MRQVVGGKFKPFGDTYAKILSLWKTSKTALSPAVHMNNVMSNFVMADFHDVGAAHVARVRYERRPSELGLTPVLAAQLHQVGPAALAAFHGARLAEAQRPVVATVPHHLVITNPPPPPPLPGPVAPPEPPPAPPTVPTFAALLEAGTIGPGTPLLLGYDRTTGTAVEGSWLDLYS
jgi:hypothetical protein